MAYKPKFIRGDEQDLSGQAVFVIKNLEALTEVGDVERYHGLICDAEMPESMREEAAQTLEWLNDLMKDAEDKPRPLVSIVRFVSFENPREALNFPGDVIDLGSAVNEKLCLARLLGAQNIYLRYYNTMMHRRMRG